MNTAEELTRQLATERERADYAWRNTRTVEAARQEEMRKRDAAEAGMATLRQLAQASLDARDTEARTARALENAEANFRCHDIEAAAYADALTIAIEADVALREALKTPNVEFSGTPAALSPEGRAASPG